MEIQIGPVSDVTPNDYSPSPSGAHYLNVDEDPHDSDGTILSTFNASREQFGLDVTAIPDSATIDSITIRHVQKRSVSGSQTYKVGLTKSAVDYDGATQSLGAGSSFASASDIWTTDPSTGLGWTKAGLALFTYFHAQLTQAGGLPRPRVTQFIAIASVTVPDNTGAPRVGAATSLAPRVGAPVSLAPGVDVPNVGEV
jgi:hypothetical protein